MTTSRLRMWSLRRPSPCSLLPVSQAIPPAAPPCLPQMGPDLSAPAHWRMVDLISDLHLQSAEPATFAAWQHYMASTAANAVFILGDLFEVWVGDDVLDQHNNDTPGFERQCQQIMASTATRLSLFFMHGNRDFLLGDTFLQGAKTTLLPDPTPLSFDGQRWLLTHGDALCLADTAYQAFRAQVRTPAWCDAFLANPLTRRQQIGRELRQQSEALKASATPLVDIDKPAACAWLEVCGAGTLIHGHTHRPMQEILCSGSTARQKRLVLSDWDANAHPPRLQVLRLIAGQPPKRVELSGT